MNDPLTPTLVIILRFFAGSFGSSPLTNAGGVVADLFAAKERGLAMSVFSVAPFMGPVLGPSKCTRCKCSKPIQLLTVTLLSCFWILRDD